MKSRFPQRASLPSKLSRSSSSGTKIGLEPHPPSGGSLIMEQADLKGLMMGERVKTKSEPKSGKETIGQRLDRELDDSFPASDPSSLTQPSGSTEDKKVVLGKRIKAAADD